MATTAAAAAVLGAPALAAHAATPSAPVGAATLLSDRPDSGFSGNTWANDSLKRVATVTLEGTAAPANCGPEASACFSYSGTISDVAGTAVAVSGARSPGAQATPIKGTPSATFTGSADVTFYASSDSPDRSLVPLNVDGGVSTADWVEQFFPDGTTFGTGPSLSNWSWTYTDAKDCQTWTDAFNVARADSGDITGTDSCTTTVQAVPPQSVTVGRPYSHHIEASTTSSDKTLTYEATGLPKGLSLDASSGEITGTVTADAMPGTATVTATDFGGVSASTQIAFSFAPPVVTLSGGHVVPGTLTASRAVVAWTATPPAPGGYQVTINGPGFNHRTGHVNIPQASYSGLHGGHTYVVSVTPLGKDGKKDGETGYISFVTK